MQVTSPLLLMLLVFFLSFFFHLWHLLHLICKRQLFFLFFFPLSFWNGSVVLPIENCGKQQLNFKLEHY